MEITPTVGRMVYFKTRGSADGVFPPTDFASIITKVYPNNRVSLATFGELGIRFEHSVPQGQEPGQWDWMPFQKDQAARLAPGTANESHPMPNGVPNALDASTEPGADLTDEGRAAAAA